MKTGTVTVRLPIEAIEQLQEAAKVQRCSLSDLLKKKILSSLETNKERTESSADLVKQLHEMETNLIAAQQAMAEILLPILTNVVGARYHASLATTYADDMITVMQTGNVLSEKEVVRRQNVREAEARRIEVATVAQVLGSKAKGGRKVN